MPAESKSRKPAIVFDTIRVEGSLISPAMLAQIAQHQADGQSEADYEIPKGLSLRDEIARYFRIGQAQLVDFAKKRDPSHAATIAFVEELLRTVFGFGDIIRVDTRSLGERQFAVTLEALKGRVPILVVPPADDLDRPSDSLPTDGRRRSAASALQDWLNANAEILWGLCSNGYQLRLVRDNASLTRPAYIEADLRRIFEAEAFADFAALWLLIHASRFGEQKANAAECALERWREEGAKAGVAARDRLRDGVEAALLSLGNGFLAHPANGELRKRLQNGELTLPEYFGQLLRLVYRLIFLLAAEDRDLLHLPNANAAARKLYTEGYSVSALRDRAVRRTAWDRHHDKWEGLGIVFFALARGEKRLGLPALDGLFSASSIPDVEKAKLQNRYLMEAIFRLAWLREPSGVVPVNWRDMETEELGSVYESLLELTPRLTEDGNSFAFAEGDESKGHARKTTGSYYTPDSLVQALLDSALDPVLDRVESEGDDPAKVLLTVTVIDPACGSGHFLLAAARRIATRLARARTDGVAAAADYRHALRDVVRACIFGVDRNPMAVELTKVALWIETVEPGKPLGFLDANIRCGDALLGVFDLKALEKGIPDDAYKPLTGDDRETANHFKARNRAETSGQGTLDFFGGAGKLPAAAPLANEAKAVRAMPEDSPEEIAAKRKRFESARTDPRSWQTRVAADLYVAAFLTPKTGGVPANRNTVTIPTTAHVWDALAGKQVYGPLIGCVQELAGTARVLHWPLEFPDVMSAGGFDVVLGNPPWEVLQLGEEEYFAQRVPEIAVLKGAKRKTAIAKLEKSHPTIFAAYQSDKRLFEAANQFARESGRFQLSAQGKINSYSLFAELAAVLTKKNGRAGVILPTGIATDSSTAAFFGSLVEGKRLIRIVDFENRERIFPAVYFRVKFCLLTIGANTSDASFSFFLTQPSQITDVDRNFTLSLKEIAKINPNTKTAPVFRTRADAELTAKIYSRVPVLRDGSGSKPSNPWGVEFRQGLFNMTSESAMFRTSMQLAEDGFERNGQNWMSRSKDRTAIKYIPLYEAKMIFYYDHRYGDFKNATEKEGIDFREIPQASEVELGDPNYEPTPRYWVEEAEVLRRLATRKWDREWLIAHRGITNATNERTLVTSVFPRSGVGNSLGLWLLDSEVPSRTMAGLIGNLASLTVDFITRQKVGGTNLNFFYIDQLPILTPSAFGQADLSLIVPRVLELTYTSHSMTPFARDLGHQGPPFKWDEERRALLRAELDAWYARAYGLTRDELRYILDPSDVRGGDYPSETFRVLKANEVRLYGEYRTARLVLDAWDRMERGELEKPSLSK